MALARPQCSMVLIMFHLERGGAMVSLSLSSISSSGSVLVVYGGSSLDSGKR